MFEEEEAQYYAGAEAAVHDEVERQVSQACRDWDDWAMWDEMNPGTSRPRKRPSGSQCGTGNERAGSGTKMENAGQLSDSAIRCQYGNATMELMESQKIVLTNSSSGPSAMLVLLGLNLVQFVRIPFWMSCWPRVFQPRVM